MQKILSRNLQNKVRLVTLLVALLGFFGRVQAQISFSVTPNPAFSDPTSGLWTTEAKSAVKNLSAAPDTFLWTRHIIRLDHDSTCKVAVEDPVLHYLPNVTQKKFGLPAGGEGELNLTLIDFKETGCCAIVHMKLEKIGNPADTLTAVYFLRECQPSSTAEQPQIEVKVIPNPFMDAISLLNADAVRAIRVFDANGRLAKFLPANASPIYRLNDLPAGSYFLVLEGDGGQFLQVFPLNKQ